MPIPQRPIVSERGETSRRGGILLSAAFVVLLTTPALVQVGFELAGWFDRADPATGKVARDRRVQALEVLTRLHRLGVFSGGNKGPTLLKHIEDFESELEDRCVASTAVQPLTQWLQLAILGEGNEKVMVGPSRWLFYRPGVSFITGRGRIGTGAPARPNEEIAETGDPLAAILNFHNELKARGIDLVLVPVPVKATIHPERLANRYDAARGPAANPVVQAFYGRLRDSGVTVLDLTHELWRARGDGDLYLPLDSHWTPKGMAIFAEALARELRRRYRFLEDPTHGFTTRPVTVANRGDLFNMLRLPAKSPLLPDTSVTTHQVVDADTKQFAESDENSRLVLLGDSASNIYSVDADMGWGAHAGLPEHLCLHLGRRIHWIAINGGGPSLTRQKLLQEGLDRKNVVVWEFLVRDLTHPLIAWEDVPVSAAPSVPAPTGRLEVRARIKKRTEPPEPPVNELLYPNTIIYTLYDVLEVIEGTYDGRELLAVEWVQKNLAFLPPTRYQVGDKHHMVLMPLKQAEKQDPSIRQAMFVDDAKRYDLPPLWVVEHKE